MLEYKEVNEIAKNIDGWVNEAEGEYLFETSRNCEGNGIILEIGSWKGKSTIYLGKGSQSGNKVKIYAVDPHTGSSEHIEEYGEVNTFDEFKKNIESAGLNNIITPVVKTSYDAFNMFDEPVEFVFIDGAHEYEQVKLDFELWFPRLIEGGKIAFHDSIGSYEGPRKVVKEYIYNSRNFKDVGFISSITFGTKVKENSLNDRIRNRIVHFFSKIMGLTYAIRADKLPKPLKTIGFKILKFMQ